MKLHSFLSGQWHRLLQAVLICLWLIVLSPAAQPGVYYSVYYSIYLLCGVLGGLCLLRNRNNGSSPPPPQRRILQILSGLFSGAVALANNNLFSPVFAPLPFLRLLLCLAGGFVVGCNILLTLFIYIPLPVSKEDRTHPCRFFCAVFFSIALIDLFYLFFVSYPGIITQDATSTIAQITGISRYNNVMPFWHTITVAPFLKCGLFFFNDLNAAVACFHCFQILFMASVMAFALVTLYQICVPRVVLALVFFLYALMPYNIVYSSTLWKDVPFSGAALLLVTALYRILRNVGRSRLLNYSLLCAGALGFCLWRTNGWYAFLAAGILLFPLLYRTQRRVLILIVVLLVVCWVLLNPVLSVLSVSDLDLIEAFAVPMQQIARMIVNDRELTHTELSLLTAVFDLDKVKNLYDPYIVDPVKFQVFHRDQADFLLEHIGEYASMYLRLGIRYPLDYLHAWVDQTKGYWNAGYVYWVLPDFLTENRFGLCQTQTGTPLATHAAAAFRRILATAPAQCLSGIGLYAWGLIACLVINILKKRKEYLLTIPILVILVGLWLGTPVFSEFRYAYPMILTMPLILPVTLHWNSD